MEELRCDALEIGTLEDKEEETVELISNGHRKKFALINKTTIHARKLCAQIIMCAVLLTITVGSVAFLINISTTHDLTSHHFPSELLDHNIYNSSDFHNELNIVPPYWNDATRENNQVLSEIPHVGPCYLPKTKPNWEDLIERNEVIKSAKNIEYKTSDGGVHDKSISLAGLCRPGFIVIGAGKCGTSSLYHYLVGHPRVLPAKNKQIHYFKYYANQPMRWYLKNFPPAEIFLSNGALMTGEASPGYLPYPDVANLLQSRMQAKAGNGNGQPLVSPKIITIARNPLERSWSSYKYNYQQPLIQSLRRQDKTKMHRSEEWYQNQYIFSFEDLIAAELKTLRECLKDGGKAEKSTSSIYGNKDWAKREISRRKRDNQPPMVALDESCYGKRISKSVPRYQWKHLVEQNPNKVIDVRNLHLVQSLVGRSLYTLPLEWWYAIYPREDLYLMCSEDLRYRTSESMSNLTDFLGLPSFNFTDVTSVGMYNVGKNTGYNKSSKWEDSLESQEDIPISDGLRKEFLDFVAPYNERLFDLVGKKCDW